MPKKGLHVLPASEADMLVIEQFARKFDLDVEAISGNQFLVVKDSDRILGFGRLRQYPECAEIATVGVLEDEQHKGIGSQIIQELISRGPREIYVTCVIPEFFQKLGFQMVKQYPAVLQKKVDFCKSYDFNDEQVFVMKMTKQ